MASRSQPSGEHRSFEVFAGENPVYAGLLNFPDHQPDAYRPSPAFQPDASAITSTFSDDVEATMTAPVRNSSGWATKEAWAQHRAEIKQLYYHDRTPLAEVKRIMEDGYGFKATVKMYKTHIKQWGLDKKIKEFEMRAIVRKYKQREDQGKGSIIRIRKEVRDFGEFVRYCHRKGISIEDIIARQTSSPTPEAVELSTPIPSPITTPQVLAIPERTFRCLRDYFEGSFESGTWVSTEPIRPCYSTKEGGNTDNVIKEFYDWSSAAFALSSFISPHEAIQKVLVATANILSAEHPETLQLLFKVIVRFRGEGTDGLGLFLLREFSALGKELRGSEHPLSRICEWSCSVDASNFEAFAVRCMESVADQLQSTIGPMHMTTLFARLELILVVGHQEEARIQMLQKLLGECEKKLRPDDVRMLWIRGHIADNYLAKGYYAGAKALSQKNIACIQDLPSTSVNSSGLIHNVYILAQCQYAIGEVHLGMATLHALISMSRFAPQDCGVRLWFQQLEDWYLEQGLCDTAAQARELMQKMSELMNWDSDSSWWHYSNLAHQLNRRLGNSTT